MDERQRQKTKRKKKRKKKPKKKRRERRSKAALKRLRPKTEEGEVEVAGTDWAFEHLHSLEVSRKTKFVRDKGKPHFR